MAHISKTVHVLLAAAIFAAPCSARAGQAAAQEPGTKVDASRGGVTFSSGANSLTIGARVQIRWMLDAREEADADLIGNGVGREDGFLTQFDVPRMRVSLSGGVYRPWLRYAFQFEFSRTSGAGSTKIKDAIIEIRPTGRPYRFTLGQFKAPFGLQELVSSGRQQFVDRAITDGKFTPGRDKGVMMAGTFGKEQLAYQAGVFDGAGEGILQTSKASLLVARISYQPLGTYALTEGAVDPPARPVVHLGLAARTGRQIRGRTAVGIVENADNQTALGAEFGYARPRFQTTAEYFWMRDELENPSPGPDLDSRGFHAQAGYMIVPRTTEVGVRVAAVDPDTDADDAGVREIRGVVNYFWQGHNLKLQGDIGQLRYGAGYSDLSSRARAGLPQLGSRLVDGRRLADTQVRVQLQLAF